MDKNCIEMVRLLLESAPAIFETPLFAMKGGTAINLFIENMPRLSVDIDVVYVNHQSARDEALQSAISPVTTAPCMKSCSHATRICHWLSRMSSSV